MRDPVEREFLLGFWKIHILHHAADARGVYGQWMLEELRHHGYRLSPGTLYPILARMGQHGWLRAAEPKRSKAARVYRLTSRGHEVLDRIRASLRELYSEVGEHSANSRPAPRRSRKRPGGNRSAARLLLFAMSVLLMPAAIHAQSGGQAPPMLTLEQAIQYATDHYPTVRAALEQVNVSAANVDVARSAYLPRLDSMWQSNRATANNVFGQVLPQGVLPALTGPVLPSASADSVWGSAAGALVSWEPFDFGLRRASVVSAQAALTRARVGETLSRLDVQNAVAAAYLSVLGAQRGVIAAQADLDRRNVLLQAVQALVTNQLRPGADQSRATAEQAAARTRVLQAQQTLALAQSALNRVLGNTAAGSTIAGDPLLERVPPIDVTPAAPSTHPFVQSRQAAIDQAKAEQDVLAHTDLPRVFVQSSVFARGSGASAAGTLDGGFDGLGFDRANWAAGVQVLFPNLFDFSSLRAKKAAASASFRANTALYDEAVLTVTSEQQTAAALLQTSRAVAANTPVQLAAAQQSETQARARYNAGLANILEVADAQNLLAQAEVQDQLARVDVWRALLAASVARGDLTPFITLLRQP